MKHFGTIIVGLLLMILGSAAQSQAVIVTDNNDPPHDADFGLIPGAGGNLVPNASFENPADDTFNGSSTIISDPGVQGSHVVQITDQTEDVLDVPVIPGQKYAYSFWYDINGAPNFSGIEYGLFPLTLGIDITPGNSGVTAIGFAILWTEATGTFIPAGGQTDFLIGGFQRPDLTPTNGFVEFDSIFVAEVPEPCTASLLGLGGLLAILRRTRRSRA